jgi:hypothetical protein
MRECFVSVDSKVDESGRTVMVTKTCKEYIAELEAKISELQSALHTLTCDSKSSTDNYKKKSAIILSHSERCNRFFLVPVLSWTSEGKTIHREETVKCVREKDHPSRDQDGIGCQDEHGWMELVND